MARRYDSRTTIFSPEGRLYQVEYAMEAIGNAHPALGILTKEGIVMATEKALQNKLLDMPHYSEKIYKLDEHMACGIAGITSDANLLIGEMRLTAQRYRLQYDEIIPCEQLVSYLCDIKQIYTQYGGKRPFGVSAIYMGHDKHFGYQLYLSDPSGNYAGWKAVAIGKNHSNANDLLKQEYKEEMTLKEAKHLAVKIFQKVGDITNLSLEKVELATLTHDKGETSISILPQPELEEIIEAVNKEVAAEKEKEKQKGGH